MASYSIANSGVSTDTRKWYVIETDGGNTAEPWILAVCDNKGSATLIANSLNGI